ncbi:MAG TPA: hypothetical protein VF427_06180, partial [Noviherbaspirillum sp.]
MWILIQIGGNALDNTERMKRARAKASQSKVFAVIGKLLFVPTISVAVIIYYIPIFLMFLLILPVALGEISANRTAKSDMARFEQGCKPIKRSSAFCTQIVENGKPIAQGFVIETSDKYVALVDHGRARVVPIKEREFLPFE